MGSGAQGAAFTGKKPPPATLGHGQRRDRPSGPGPLRLQRGPHVCPTPRARGLLRSDFTTTKSALRLRVPRTRRNCPGHRGAWPALLRTGRRAPPCPGHSLPHEAPRSPWPGALIPAPREAGGVCGGERTCPKSDRCGTGVAAPARDGDPRGRPGVASRPTSRLHPDEAVLHDVDAAHAVLAPAGRVGQGAGLCPPQSHTQDARRRLGCPRAERTSEPGHLAQPPPVHAGKWRPGQGRHGVGATVSLLRSSCHAHPGSRVAPALNTVHRPPCPASGPAQSLAAPAGLLQGAADPCGGYFSRPRATRTGTRDCAKAAPRTRPDPPGP